MVLSLSRHSVQYTHRRFILCHLCFNVENIVVNCAEFEHILTTMVENPDNRNMDGQVTILDSWISTPPVRGFGTWDTEPGGRWFPLQDIGHRTRGMVVPIAGHGTQYHREGGSCCGTWNTRP